MKTVKTAIVTGAGSGIGKATALRLARDGFAVVLAGRTAARLQAVADEIAAPDRVAVVPTDVAKPEDIAALIAEAITRFGRLDVLVNNAAVAVFGGIEDVTPEAWDAQMRTNATAIFLAIKAALPHLEKTGGNVVNVSSASGLRGDWGLFSYNATKGAVSNMTRALALDLGARGLRVNAVAPSLTATEMTARLTEDDTLMAKFRDRIPMQRAAEPAEVADVIAFLAGEDARFVNGVILPVDGGVTASNGQPKLT